MPYHRQDGGLTSLDLNPDGRDHNVRHGQAQSLSAYATRLRKGLTPEDYRQVFDQVVQPGLFDRPLAEMHPVWMLAP